MLLHLKSMFHRRPWAVGAAGAALLVELILALLWLTDPSRGWVEPAIVIVGLILVILGIPSLRDLLGKAEEEARAQHDAARRESDEARARHDAARRESEDRVRQVGEVYLRLTTGFPPQTAGMNGFVQAGVYRLKCDSEIRSAIQFIEEHGARSPLGNWSDGLYDKDLFWFFQEAKARKFDFLRIGSPGDILANWKRAELEKAPNPGPQADS